MDGNMVSDAMWTSRGVAPGSPHARFETSAHMLLAIRYHCAMNPEIAYSVSVGDIALTAKGSSEEKAADNAVAAAVSLVASLSGRLALPFDDDKLVVFSTSAVVAAGGVGVGAPHCGSRRGQEARLRGGACGFRQAAWRTPAQLREGLQSAWGLRSAGRESID